ncbi:MAG: hypothetical protein ACYC5M_12670 [Anaerolineae bacterium]
MNKDQLCAYLLDLQAKIALRWQQLLPDEEIQNSFDLLGRIAASDGSNDNVLFDLLAMQCAYEDGVAELDSAGPSH